MPESPDEHSPVPPDPSTAGLPHVPSSAPEGGPPAEPASPAPDLTPRPFRFTGSGSEYFRIWIVNLLLSVATLGIYSAWAKVRRLRYFHGHTSVDGSAFGYHAAPRAILKGRIIAFAVVATLAVVSEVAPLAASVLYLPLLMVLPIVLVRSLRFRAFNSSYRGVRFGFAGSEPHAYQVFVFLPLLVPLTLGLAYPLMVARQREFVVGQSRHGDSPFTLQLPVARVYGIYIVAGVLFVLLSFSIGAVAFGAGFEGDLTDLPPARQVLGMALLYAGAGVILVVLRTAFENLVWNHTRLDEHAFESRLRARDMLWLYGSNALAIALTFGAFVPWARVRLARYRASALTLLPHGPLASVSSAIVDDVAATASEFSDALDLDFGL
ncbi:MAG: YjgN family protein [Vicinamibacterales bacterium]